MSKNDENTADFASLQNDFQELRNDVNSLFKHLSNDAGHDFKDAVSGVKNENKKAFDGVFAHDHNPIINEFKKHPIAATLIALGIGYMGLRTFLK